MESQGKLTSTSCPPTQLSPCCSSEFPFHYSLEKYEMAKKKLEWKEDGEWEMTLEKQKQ